MDCYIEFSSAKIREHDKENDYSFDKVEKALLFWTLRRPYTGTEWAEQKTRHTERNRIATDLLTNNNTCPEESIYQIGIIDESISGEILDKIATEFFAEIKENSTIRSMKQLSITVSG